MKICLHTTHQISHHYIGGTERFLIKLAKELRILGWEPFIVCSSMTPELFVEGIKVLGRIPKEYRKNITKYTKFNYNFLKQELLADHPQAYETALRLSSYVDKQLDGIDADIYHFNSFLSASFLTSSHVKKFIVTNHENDVEMNSFWGKDFFKKFSSLVKNRELKLQNANGLYVPSEYYAELFAKSFALPVIPMKLGVLLNDFPQLPNKKNLIREEYLNDTDGLIILLPSRLNVYQKGHDIALKACKILKEKSLNFQLLITGLGKSSELEVNSFRRMIKDFDVEDAVILSSYSDIIDAYKICDIVISPERYCSYGLSISESLAMGINTILSNIPTYIEIATGYKHAHFFEINDAEELAKQILQVWRMKKTNYRLDMIRFRINNDIRDCAKKYSNIYNRLLTNGK